MKYYDMEVHRGETFLQEITLVDTDGNPIDLTGKAAKAQVRPSPQASVITANMSAGVIGSQGKISFRLDASQTKNIPVGTYAYDVCTYEDISGVRYVKYYIGGKFKVLPSVTDAL